MLASADQKHHKDHIYKKNSIDLLKTAALYGANGAGKSNLIKAINLLKRIVTTGGKETFNLVKKYKLEPEYQEVPTLFEIEFIKNDIAYLYSLEIHHDRITEESLYKSGLENKQDEIIFHKTEEQGDLKIEFSELYSRTEKDKFNLAFVQNNLVKDDVPLIKILSDLKEDFKEVKIVFEWFKNNLITIFPNTKPGSSLIAALIGSQELKNFTNSSMKTFNTGISSIDIKTFPYIDIGSNISYEEIKKEVEEHQVVGLTSASGSDGLIAMFENDEIVVKRFVGEHKNIHGIPIEFFLNEESDGTNRLLDFIPAFFQLLNSEVVVLIDEIDQSIHPVLLKELVKKFVSDEKTKGQFIFTTHEANLLDQSIFRRDEIWFVEKDHGETKLYPLSDFDIRYDLDIRKGYLNGRFGAIPFMGDLQNLNWDQYAEAE
jgi:AAA15 family ATPase/GTPase